MPAPSIDFQAVSKRYRIYHQRHQTLKEMILKLGRGRWDELWALREVTAQIYPGQTVGVIGENGAGKSTLLKLIASILQPDGGRLTVQGRVQAGVMSALPIGFAFFVRGFNANYFDQMFSEPIGQAMMAAAVVLWIAGVALLIVMSKVEY